MPVPRITHAAVLLGGAALLALLSMPDAGAVPTPVASASATAVTVTVLGTPIGSGTYRASDDGADPSTDGPSRPEPGDLTGQTVLTDGLLAQDAAATSGSRHGTAWSCAGLAGPNATRTAPGSPTCLQPADAVTLHLGAVDLSSLGVVTGTVSSGLDPAVLAKIRGNIGALAAHLDTALRDGLTTLGTPRVVARLDVAQAACTSSRTGTQSATTLSGASLRLQVPGRPDVVLATLDDQPAVASRVGADLAALPGLLTTDLTPGLRDVVAADENGVLTSAEVDAVVSTLTGNLTGQLTAFADPLLSVDLNQVTRSPGHRITVTALDLRVGDALQQYGVDAARLQVGRVSCASAARTASTAGAGGTTGGTTGSQGTVAGPGKGAAAAGGAVVPRKVAAGEPTLPRDAATVLAAGMLLLGLGGGAVGAQYVARRQRR